MLNFTYDKKLKGIVIVEVEWGKKVMKLLNLIEVFVLIWLYLLPILLLFNTI